MNKFAIVTGASGAIGSSITQAFLGAGFSVLQLDKTFQQEEILDASSRNIRVKCDLVAFCKNPQYRSLVASKVRSELKDKCDYLCLINNAAVQTICVMEDINYELWDEAITVNSLGPALLSQEFRDELLAFSGDIVNVSSIHGRLTKSGFGIYAASKAALESVTRSLALEWSGSGISVNAVAPAAVDTSMLKEGFKEHPEMLDQLATYHPAGIIASSAGLAQLILSLVGSGDKFLSGSIVDYSGAISSRLFDPN